MLCPSPNFRQFPGPRPAASRYGRSLEGAGPGGGASFRPAPRCAPRPPGVRPAVRQVRTYRLAARAGRVAALVWPADAGLGFRVRRLQRWPRAATGPPPVCRGPALRRAAARRSSPCAAPAAPSRSRPARAVSAGQSAACGVGFARPPPLLPVSPAPGLLGVQARREVCKVCSRARHAGREHGAALGVAGSVPWGRRRKGKPGEEDWAPGESGCLG